MSTTAEKLREWVRRNLPCEVAGTTCEMGGAAIASGMTGTAAVAALVATIGPSVGYYAGGVGAIGAVVDEALGSSRDYTMLAEPGGRGTVSATTSTAATPTS